MSLTQILSGGLLLRLGLIGYGEWQDKLMNLKYTDIDYSVFSDAAIHVSQVSFPMLSLPKILTRLVVWTFLFFISKSPLLTNYKFIFQPVVCFPLSFITYYLCLLLQLLKKRMMMVINDDN